MELWFTEKETDNLKVQHRLERTLFHQRSKFQDVAVVECREFGRMLVLDGIIQTSVRDEFIYHEMIAHVPLFLHPNPERVLVIGGGDGGTVREVLKHEEVREIDLVEIDEMVVQVSQQYLPELAGQLSHPKVSVHVADGIQWVKDHRASYDVILVDSSDPLGPAVGLFTSEFYGDTAKALRPDGLLAIQGESAFFTPRLVKDILQAMKTHYNHVHYYTASVPTYSQWPWGFALASQQSFDPTQSRRPHDEEAIKTRYYSQEMHRAAFSLPPFIREVIEDAIA